ncbi:hypothetical protein [Methanosarcina mazei]|uniref:hypothetical protein n=1 Tax=Methanosarcina mazei TaxID=2209 RepID=UPI001F1748C3|nr:hypothetical protein [Methanosarcina mazei]
MGKNLSHLYGWLWREQMNAKDGILVLHVAIVLCLFLPPLAMASTEEQQTNQTKDAAQLEMEALEAEMGEEGMKKVAEYLQLQASLPDAVKASPYSSIAFAATDNESRAAYMTAIDESDLKKEDKEKLKADLQDIWERYPDDFKVEDNEPLKVINEIMTKRFIQTQKSARETSTKEQNITPVKDAAQLKMEALEAELGEEGMKKVADYLELQASLPDVVKRMPYKGLAFAATDPESQAITMGYIDNFDVSEKEKERYKARLQDIWDRYPENITEDDYAFMSEIGPMVEKESLKKYQDQNNSNNIDSGSNNGSRSNGSNSVGNEPSKSNSAPGFGLLGSLTCLYGGRKLRKK